MEARYLERAGEGQELTREVLHGAELALKHKLRRRFSADFVSRHADDLVAQAANEYVATLNGGAKIRNPGGFLVDVGYKRALDAFGKESRAPAIDDLDVDLPLADPRSPQPLEEIEGREERSQLYEAVARLDPEERRVIALVYFEGISGRDAAEPLGVSESTSLRRLRSAQGKLREWLPAIEQGRFCGEAAPQLRALSEGTASDSERIQAGLHLRNCASCREAFARRQEFAFEVGLAAWLSIATAQVQPVHVGDQLVAIADTAREWAASALGRGRDLLVRFLSSGGGEVAGGASAGPLSKTAAACSAAAAACALTGVIGPGVGGVDLVGQGQSAAPQKVRRAPVALPRPPGPPPNVTLHSSKTLEAAASSQAVKGSGSSRERSSSVPTTSGGSAADTSADSQFGVESLSGSSGGAAPSQPVTPSGQSSDQAADQQFGLP